MMKIQQILRHEITWLAVVLGAGYGIVTTVVLPINQMQLQITEIQQDFNTQIVKYDALNTTVNSLTTIVSILQERIDNISKR